MGTDIYHYLNPETPEYAAALNQIIDEAKQADDQAEPCFAYECDTCRRNEDETSDAVRELSRRFPRETFSLLTEWSEGGSPQEYRYFRNGGVVITDVRRIWVKPPRKIEPETVTRVDAPWPKGCESA